MEDYWRIRNQVLGLERSEADNRPFGKRPTLHAVPVPVAHPAPAAPGAGSPKPMSVSCILHPKIAEVATERYNRGAYNDAEHEACRVARRTQG
ncbi:hypothetical protein [Streptomyces sp. NPDC007856]|uniref:hypothetical protein n=1 Tax=Streptomyces sp. NPDC007856 TaxID=3364781 RepID=UPI0036CA8862